jgi:hypothetical protein
MLAEYPTFRESKRATLEGRIFKGIPEKVRGKAWLFIGHPASVPFELGKAAKPDRREKHYEHWKASAVPLPQAPAGIPGLGPLAGNSADDLATLVGALLAVDRTKIPYSPNLGYIASLLLAYLPAWQAGTLYVELFTSSKRRASNYFHEGQVAQLAAVWGLALQKKVPKVHERLLKLGVDHKAYLAEWLQTAFLAIDFVPELSLRIFDRYVKYGTRTLISFGVTIAYVLQDKVVAAGTAPDALRLLRDPSKDPRFRYVPDIVKKLDQLTFFKKEYLAIVSKAGYSPRGLP